MTSINNLMGTPNPSFGLTSTSSPNPLVPQTQPITRSPIQGPSPQSVGNPFDAAMSVLANYNKNYIAASAPVGPKAPAGPTGYTSASGATGASVSYAEEDYYIPDDEGCSTNNNGDNYVYTGPTETYYVSTDYSGYSNYIATNYANYSNYPNYA